MTEEFKSNNNNPEMLEKLFTENQKTFESGFEIVYPEIKDSEMAGF